MCKKVGVWSSYLQMGVGINTGSLHEFGVNMKGVKKYVQRMKDKKLNY
jgi:hypothetical protein